MKRALFVALCSALGVYALIAIACQSSEGERCQVDADCSGGLKCNVAKNVCQGTNNMPLDVLYPEVLPVDASTDTP